MEQVRAIFTGYALPHIVVPVLALAECGVRSRVKLGTSGCDVYTIIEVFIFVHDLVYHCREARTATSAGLRRAIGNASYPDWVNTSQ